MRRVKGQLLPLTPPVCSMQPVRSDAPPSGSSAPADAAADSPQLRPTAVTGPGAPASPGRPPGPPPPSSPPVCDPGQGQHLHCSGEVRPVCCASLEQACIGRSTSSALHDPTWRRRPACVQRSSFHCLDHAFHAGATGARDLLHGSGRVGQAARHPRRSRRRACSCMRVRPTAAMIWRHTATARPAVHVRCPAACHALHMRRRPQQPHVKWGSTSGVGQRFPRHGTA
jgi:hypothetical protein